MILVLSSTLLFISSATCESESAIEDLRMISCGRCVPEIMPHHRWRTLIEVCMTFEVSLTHLVGPAEDPDAARGQVENVIPCGEVISSMF